MQGVIPNAFRRKDDRSKDWPAKVGTPAFFPILGDYRDCYESATCRAVNQGKSRMFFLKGADLGDLSVDLTPILDCMQQIKDLLTAEPDPCKVTPFTSKLVGPGTFTDADLGAAGAIISIAFIPLDGNETGTISGPNGEAVSLNCGAVKAWNTVVDPAAEKLCPLEGFEVTLGDGECVEIIGQHI